MSAPVTDSSVVVRPAVRADAPAYLALIQALADFEQLTGPDEAARTRLIEDAFGPRPRYQVLVAELDGDVVAYAIFFPTYSTFRARESLYLEDLFVHPRARRRGVASAMMKHLEQLARERGCGRFEWTVLDWNTDAQKLYDGLGAQKLRQWMVYRIDLPDPPG
ncbi:MAG: GNAT family N-acetyltransferase [Deltaproteobacteria bacterium]|nr:GNAT family N-acetyltransferase [Deltaproteobacteria bacterium]